ncbi:MAG: transcription-repair coupling factor [Lachnospiraceae bacterium]|nr:transcription-repair coupling factor [Lachnospiraceae bacterium]
MNNLTALLNNSAEFLQTREALIKGRTPVSITGVADSDKCHFVAALSEQFNSTLIVTYNDLRAKEIYDDMRFFSENVCIYPAKDLIFYSADIKGNAIVKDRMQVVRRLVAGEKCIVIMSLDAAMDKILPKERIAEQVLSFAVGDEVDTKTLPAKLVSLGYERQDNVSSPGEFAVRGGIIDIFAINDESPTRLELFGDEIDVIKSFDAESQRSQENLDSLTVFPATEFPLTDDEMYEGFEKIRKEASRQEKVLRKDIKNEQAHRLITTCEEAIETIEFSRGKSSVDSFVECFFKETCSIINYFGENDLIVFDEPMRLSDKGEATLTEFSESMIGRLESGYIIPSQANVIFDPKKIFAMAEMRRLLVVSTLDYGFAGIKLKEEYNLLTKTINNYISNIEMLVKDVESYRKKKYKTIIVTGSQAKARRLAEELGDYDIPAIYVDNREREILQGEVIVVNGALHKGFEYPNLHVAVLVEGDSFGAGRKKQKKTFGATGKEIHSLHELTYGDYVVHERSGLGIYRGIEKRETDKSAIDYIKIEYNDGELYIPATGLEAIQKYASGDADKKPKINKLNSPEWKRTKARVERAVTDIAEKLVSLYAIRSMDNGFAYDPDNEWQREFEELFPYEETDDQLKAIDDTKRDMESTRIMDRLICGDVGYGKTEIALRAAFKAVQNNKQVAVLVPTTILAQQHYNTFSSRMLNYGVNVHMMSRFRTAAQQKDTLKLLSEGRVDIVIGTHRLLSEDVKFKNLGLLVVDEEQRFGVTHKEKIKELKKDVDVLTLTATPIPRTLHMSLSGIRDMSVLEEAPVDRLPIQTFVMEHNDEIIREAINRELARGGQVYYVYNRVAGLEDRAALVQKLCPDANVVFAHGQMSERQLEKIMYAFISGEIDVLVSTTIVETGIDISNVNTMIIDDADKMGLSQLYQLRGRVGRSARTAYAFLMYKRGQVLKEVAEKRLQAIREFTDLGSGFKIAMRDLEIRGAGNVLGAEQSGHMEEVGYDLYCKMLDTAVKKAKGESVPLEEFETQIKMDVAAFIPSNYIRSESDRLDMYKRIAMIETEEERMDMIDELVDRYGDVPATVNSLLYVAQIKAMCHSVYITSLLQQGEGAKLTFFNNPPIKTEFLDGFLTEHNPYVKLVMGKDGTTFLTYIFPKEKKKLTAKEAEQKMFDNIKTLLNDMKVLY